MYHVCDCLFVCLSASRFGDMRLMLGKHVRIMWTKLADKKGNFIPNLIGPFLEITLLNRKGGKAT